MFNTYTHIDYFEFILDEASTVSIRYDSLKQMKDFPDQIAQEIYHFVNDIAIPGTKYIVLFDIYKKFGRVRVRMTKAAPLV